VSVTVIVPEVVTLPLLPTLMVYVPGVPIAKFPVCDFAIVSTGAPASVVGSMAVGEFEAPPPLAVAEFVTEPGSVPMGMVTPRVMLGNEDEPAIVAVDVHVTTCAASLQLQPLPEADAYVSPAGNVSTIVVVPEVAALPLLLTAIVYEPLPPIVKLPVCDLTIASTGAPVSVVGSVAVGVLLAPPPDAVAEFVTLPGGPTALTVSEIELPAAAAAMTVVLVQVTI
jgi:hypothetical protein